MAEAKPDAEGFAEDAVSLPNHDASIPDSGNKFDYSGSGDPGTQTMFPVNPSFGENDFPRQTGNDTLSTDEALLT